MYDLVPTSKEGKLLVDEALAARKKRITDQCVGEVESVVQWIHNLEAQITEAKRRLDIFKRRLEAIESGKVGFTQDGGPIRIEYNEKALRTENAGC